MMTRDHGFVVFECEVCDEVLDTGEKDFGTARIKLQDEGWTYHYREATQEWEHFCPKHGEE